MTRPAIAGAAAAAALLLVVWWLSSPSAQAPPAGEPAEPSPEAPTDGGPGSPSPGPPAAGGTGPTEPAEPTEPAVEPTEPAEPAAGTEPTEVAPPAPSPATAPVTAPPLVGSATLADPSGDLTDSAGDPPPRAAPAADLTAVRLEGSGDELAVTWSLAGDVPASASSLVWSLDVWVGGEAAYTVTVQQVGARRLAASYDWAAGEQRALPGAPEVAGSEITVRVPAALLERVDGAFQWQALAQLDGGYEDYVPDEATLAWFPAGGD